MPAKLTILYDQPQDPAAFEEYYVNRHLPFATESMSGVQRAELSRITPGPDGDAAPHYRIAEMHWSDLDSLRAALDSPPGRSGLADLDNFATGGTTLLISDIEPPS